MELVWQEVFDVPRRTDGVDGRVRGWCFGSQHSKNEAN